MYHDRLIRASFGTTKYCSYFLNNEDCLNPDCVYLHRYGEDIETVTKVRICFLISGRNIWEHNTLHGATKECVL